MSQVSIIIPAYNQAQYLGAAVRSALAQTCSDLEVVVVDDGSTDATPEVLAAVSDPRLRVIRQPNAGLSAARNTGLRASAAPLVTFLDSDDLFLPHKLAVLGTFLDEHPEVGLAAGFPRTIDLEGRTLAEGPIRPVSLALPDLLLGNPLHVGAVMLRRAWLDQVGLFDESLRACEDWDLWLRLAVAGCRFAWVEQVVSCYRFHPGQMTRESGRMRKAALAVLDKLYARSDLPAAVSERRAQAYAQALLRSAGRAYHSHEFELARQDLAMAAQLDQALTGQGYRPIVEALLGWAYASQYADPDGYLAGVYEHLPPSLPGLRHALRQAMASHALATLFREPPVSWQRRWRSYLRAGRYDPRCLFNRGALRILLAGPRPAPPRAAAPANPDGRS